MTTHVDPVPNLFDYFLDRVQAARSDDGVSLSADADLYLARLLTERAHVVADDDPNVTLVELHAHAAGATPGEQARAYRALGDKALYELGYFRERVERRAVSARYVASMGTAAYDRVDRVLERWFAAAFGPLFRELAEHFDDCARVLGGVRKVHDELGDVSHLHETWLRTGDEGVARKLRRLGLLIPTTPATS